MWENDYASNSQRGSEVSLLLLRVRVEVVQIMEAVPGPAIVLETSHQVQKIALEGHLGTPGSQLSESEA